MYVFANFIVFGSILGFYELHFSTLAIFIARRIPPSIFLEGGGVYLGYFFVVVVSCFIFREYFSTLTCKCFSGLVASQNRKFLSIICVLPSPAVGVLHSVQNFHYDANAYVLQVISLLDLASKNSIFNDNLKQNKKQEASVNHLHDVFT